MYLVCLYSLIKFVQKSLELIIVLYDTLAYNKMCF